MKHDSLRVDIRSPHQLIVEADEVLGDRGLRGASLGATVTSIFRQQHGDAHFAVPLERVSPVIDELRISVRKNHRRRRTLGTGATGRDEESLDLAFVSVDRETLETFDSLPRAGVHGCRVAGKDEPALPVQCAHHSKTDERHRRRDRRPPEPPT